MPRGLRRVEVKGTTVQEGEKNSCSRTAFLVARGSEFLVNRGYDPNGRDAGGDVGQEKFESKMRRFKRRFSKVLGVFSRSREDDAT